MGEAELDVTPLQRALERLREGLERFGRESQDAQLRDGLIQRFEFTYELSHKMLKRYLRLTSPSPEVIEAMSFPELIRTANGRGLLRGEWADWRTFRDLRSKTSHTYDEECAREVVAAIPQFLEEVAFLYSKIKVVNP